VLTADAQKATSNSGGFVMGLDHALSPQRRLEGGFSANVNRTLPLDDQDNANGTVASSSTLSFAEGPPSLANQIARCCRHRCGGGFDLP